MTVRHGTHETSEIRNPSENGDATRRDCYDLFTIITLAVSQRVVVISYRYEVYTVFFSRRTSGGVTAGAPGRSVFAENAPRPRALDMTSPRYTERSRNYSARRRVLRGHFRFWNNYHPSGPERFFFFFIPIYSSTAMIIVFSNLDRIPIDVQVVFFYLCFPFNFCYFLLSLHENEPARSR